jgi:BioD-like phosphotransacetylase family protein
VAAKLGAPAIIVSGGGIGRPIDEIVLNAALFERHGVLVAGAIVNKVDTSNQPGIAGVLERGLAPYGIPLLGTIPISPMLSNPTLAMILEGIGGEEIHLGPDLDRVIDSVAIGAMEPGHMLERVGPGTLVIVPGDREDVILTLTTAHLMGPAGSADPAEFVGHGARNALSGHEGAAIGLVLTGGYRPRQAVLDAIRRADLFATLLPEDTYSVASEVHDLLVKTHAADREKIELIKHLVAENLDMDRILGVAAESRPR